MRTVFVVCVALLIALGTGVTGAQAPPLQVKQLDDTGGALTLVLTVTDPRGRPIEGIAVDRFALALDGAPVAVQEVRYATDPDAGVAVVLALDISGSMAGERLARAKASAVAFLDTLQPSDQAALLVFSDTVTLLADFTPDRTAMKRTIQQLNAAGNTALYDATVTAIAKVSAAPLTRRAVIVLTDGENINPKPQATRDGAIEGARLGGVPIYSIGLGSEADRPYLDRLAEVSRGQAQHAPSPGDLDRLYAGIAASLRGQYIVRGTPPPVKRAADHTVRVSVEVDGAIERQEVRFIGSGLALLPDATPAPTPTPTPTVQPTAEPRVMATTPPPERAEVATASRSREDETGMGMRAWTSVLLIAVGIGGLGFALWMRRRAARADDTPSDQPGDATLIPLPAAGAELDPPELAILHVSHGPLVGARISLSDAPVTLGTSPDCTVVLPPSGGDVERQHARIWRRDGHFMIHRLARHGEVRVEEQPIQWAILEQGDRIEIGPHAFDFALTITVGADA